MRERRTDSGGIDHSKLAMEWYILYISKHYNKLKSSDVYMPIWQLLALATEILDSGDVAEQPRKYEMITEFAKQYCEKGFPPEHVMYIAEQALNYAHTGVLPEPATKKIHSKLKFLLK